MERRTRSASHVEIDLDDYADDAGSRGLAAAAFLASTERHAEQKHKRDSMGSAASVASADAAAGTTACFADEPSAQRRAEMDETRKDWVTQAMHLYRYAVGSGVFAQAGGRTRAFPAVRLGACAHWLHCPLLPAPLLISTPSSPPVPRSAAAWPTVFVWTPPQTGQ